MTETQQGQAAPVRFTPAHIWARGLRDVSFPVHIDMRRETLRQVHVDQGTGCCPRCGGKVSYDQRMPGAIFILYAHRDGCPWYLGFLRDIDRAKVLPLSATPIERKFWDACSQLGLLELAVLIYQYRVGRYRLDFAFPACKIGIELDGFASHSSTADIARDRKRQRELEAMGWHIIRFGGSEVHHDSPGCAREAARLIRLRVEARHD